VFQIDSLTCDDADERERGCDPRRSGSEPDGVGGAKSETDGCGAAEGGPEIADDGGIRDSSLASDGMVNTVSAQAEIARRLAPRRNDVSIMSGWDCGER
jgi:hypothetical protein